MHPGGFTMLYMIPTPTSFSHWKKVNSSQGEEDAYGWSDTICRVGNRDTGTGGICLRGMGRQRAQVMYSSRACWIAIVKGTAQIIVYDVLSDHTWLLAPWVAHVVRHVAVSLSTPVTGGYLTPLTYTCVLLCSVKLSVFFLFHLCSIPVQKCVCYQRVNKWRLCRKYSSTKATQNIDCKQALVANNWYPNWRMLGKREGCVLKWKS